jgi:hypothetical protein
LAIQKLIDEARAETGLRLVIPEQDMRPSLWVLYDKQYPGYFPKPANLDFFIPDNIEIDSDDDSEEEWDHSKIKP